MISAQATILYQLFLCMICSLMHSYSKTEQTAQSTVNTEWYRRMECFLFFINVIYWFCWQIREQNKIALHRNKTKFRYDSDIFSRILDVSYESYSCMQCVYGIAQNDALKFMLKSHEINMIRGNVFTTKYEPLTICNVVQLLIFLILRLFFFQVLMMIIMSTP